MKRFQLFIRFLVSVFASREFAFVYCIIGTLAQTSHTYYLVESISSLEGITKHLQAFGLSLFISSSLLFFTAIAGSDKTKDDYKRNLFAVNLFMMIEIIINTYYYAAHLIIKSTIQNWFDFVFALLISCLIPVTIKLYAGIIDAKTWFEEISKTDEKPVEYNQTQTEPSSELKETQTSEYVPTNIKRSSRQSIKIE